MNMSTFCELHACRLGLFVTLVILPAASSATGKKLDMKLSLNVQSYSVLPQLKKMLPKL